MTRLLDLTKELHEGEKGEGLDEYLAEHLSIKRLLDVAVSDNLTFTPLEFNHLKACSECLRQLTQVINYLPG